MLQIHFTTEDLAKTRFAPGPDPLWELTLSMHQLRLRQPHPLLRGWRRETAHLLRPGGQLRREVALALAVSPPRGYFPDFLTPLEATGGFESGLDAVLSVPQSRLRHEIDLLAAENRPTAQVMDLGRGDPRALAELGDALRRYREVALDPVWDRVTAAVTADRNRRTRQLVNGGWAEVLDNLHPQARFAGGVLAVGAWGKRADEDLHLDGRGLLLVPAYFKETHQLMVLADTQLPPVLVYPIDAGVRSVVDAAYQPLAALVGRTRSTVLELAASGGTTSEIALALRISIPAASKHLGVLRQAGLVVSTRDRNRVLHTLTPLGRALLLGRLTSDFTSGVSDVVPDWTHGPP